MSFQFVRLSCGKRFTKGALVAICMILVVVACLQYSVDVNSFTARRVAMEPIPLTQSTNPINWVHPVCNCTREYPLTNNTFSADLQQLSTCGPMADARGPHQRVVSFAFYGNVSNRFFQGIEKNANLISKLYPGWTMRVYHNISTSNKEDTRMMCDVVCKHPHLDDCNVGDLYSRLGYDMNKKFGMIWRFMPIGDPLVDVFLCRDLDSTIQQREVDAVNQWMESNKTFHITKDHFAHEKEIIGCCWAARNSANFTEMAKYREEILKEAKEIHYGYDEYLLKIIIYPQAMKSHMSHDSYHCKKNPGTIPFPTQRTEKTFVGDRELFWPEWENIHQCPIECRPRDHQDWIRC